MKAKREEKYLVVLKNWNGEEVSNRTAETLKAAKSEAKYMLSDEYAASGEVTHDKGETETVEVLNRDDEVVFDDSRVW